MQVLDVIGPLGWRARYLKEVDAQGLTIIHPFSLARALDEQTAINVLAVFPFGHLSLHKSQLMANYSIDIFVYMGISSPSL